MAKSSKFSFSNIMIWIFLAMLIVGLAGFGMNNFGSTVRSVGAVGKTVIDGNTYVRSLDQQLQALRQQAGTEVSFAEAEQMGLAQTVLQQQIARTAIEEAARQATLSVGDDEVAKRIQAVQAFQNATGQFDRDTYKFVLQRSGMTVDTFEASVRREAAAALIQGAVTAGMTPPKTYGETLYAFIAEQRTVTLAPVLESMLEAAPEAPTEDEVQAYYDANPALFTDPASRHITYAWLSPDMMVDQVELSDADLRAAYEAHSYLYNRPERRMINRLGFADMAAAEAAKARLDAGEITFDALLAERGLSEADVDLGAVVQSDLSADAGAAVFALTDTGLAGPVNSLVGPAIFRVNAILAAQTTSYEDALPELRADLAKTEAAKLVAGEVEPLDDQLASGATLEELAQDTAMALGTTEWREGVYGDTAPLTSDAFNAAAAQVAADDFPQIEQAEDGSLFALRLDSVTEARLKPLDEVRDQATAGAAAAKLTAALQAQGEILKGAVTEGQSFADLGLTPASVSGLTRQRLADGMTPAQQTAAFEMSQGEVRVISDETGTVLMRLDAVTHPDARAPEAQAVLQQISQQTAQAMLNEVMAQFATAVANDAGVKLDQTAINAYHSALR